MYVDVCRGGVVGKDVVSFQRLSLKVVADVLVGCCWIS